MPRFSAIKFPVLLLSIGLIPLVSSCAPAASGGSGGGAQHSGGAGGKGGGKAGSGGGSATGGGSVAGGGTGGFTGSPECAGTLIFCDGKCIDGATNVQDCGGCGHTCRGGEVCNWGICQQLPEDCVTSGGTCAAGYTCDPSSRHCVPGCRLQSDCPAHSACEKGTCVCDDDLHLCGSGCVPRSSTGSCGASCTPCPKAPSNGSPTCDGNQCDFACTSGAFRCLNRCDVCQLPAGAKPLCSSDPCDYTCGEGNLKCGSACATCQTPLNATAVCKGSACDFTCNTDYHRCGNDCLSNGSPQSCGAACTPCPSAPANASPTCNANRCDFACNAGWLRCGDGCCRSQAVTSGMGHTCALTTAGGVKCWGHNYYGQVGDGTNKNKLQPVAVVGLTSGVSLMSSGGTHTCVLMTDGQVKCWGDNFFGQLGNGSTVASYQPVQVLLPSSVSSVRAGYAHACAMTMAGGIKCWGSNKFGTLGDGTYEPNSRPVDVIGMTSGVSAIGTCRAEHICALTTDGGLKCWGNNDYGELGDGSNNRYSNRPVDVVGLTSGITAVSVGGSHSCALTAAGGVKCWGDNASGQLGDGSNSERRQPVDVWDLASGVRAISAGNSHTCALMNDGTIKCWGANVSGQLGNGTTSQSNTPVNVVALSGVSMLSAGDAHNCALTYEGAIKCWGANGYGQLGNSEYKSSPKPIDVLER